MKGPNILGLVEFVLVFGLVLGLAVWQLIQLRRDKIDGTPRLAKSTKKIRRSQRVMTSGIGCVHS